MKYLINSSSSSTYTYKNEIFLTSSISPCNNFLLILILKNKNEKFIYELKLFYLSNSTSLLYITSIDLYDYYLYNNNNNNNEDNETRQENNIYNNNEDNKYNKENYKKLKEYSQKILNKINLIWKITSTSTTSSISSSSSSTTNSSTSSSFLSSSSIGSSLFTYTILVSLQSQYIILSLDNLNNFFLSYFIPFFTFSTENLNYYHILSSYSPSSSFYSLSSSSLTSSTSSSSTSSTSSTHTLASLSNILDKIQFNIQKIFILPNNFYTLSYLSFSTFNDSLGTSLLLHYNNLINKTTSQSSSSTSSLFYDDEKENEDVSLLVLLEENKTSFSILESSGRLLYHILLDQDDINDNDEIDGDNYNEDNINRTKNERKEIKSIPIFINDNISKISLYNYGKVTFLPKCSNIKNNSSSFYENFSFFSLSLSSSSPPPSTSITSSTTFFKDAIFLQFNRKSGSSSSSSTNSISTSSSTTSISSSRTSKENYQRKDEYFSSLNNSKLKNVIILSFTSLSSSSSSFTSSNTSSPFHANFLSYFLLYYDGSFSFLQHNIHQAFSSSKPFKSPRIFLVTSVLYEGESPRLLGIDWKIRESDQETARDGKIEEERNDEVRQDITRVEEIVSFSSISSSISSSLDEDFHSSNSTSSYLPLPSSPILVALISTSHIFERSDEKWTTISLLKFRSETLPFLEDFNKSECLLHFDQLLPLKQIKFSQSLLSPISPFISSTSSSLSFSATSYVTISSYIEKSTHSSYLNLIFHQDRFEMRRLESLDVVYFSYSFTSSPSFSLYLSPSTSSSTTSHLQFSLNRIIHIENYKEKKLREEEEEEDIDGGTNSFFIEILPFYSRINQGTINPHNSSNYFNYKIIDEKKSEEMDKMRDYNEINQLKSRSHKKNLVFNNENDEEVELLYEDNEKYCYYLDKLEGKIYYFNNLIQSSKIDTNNNLKNDEKSLILPISCLSFSSFLSLPIILSKLLLLQHFLSTYSPLSSSSSSTSSYSSNSTSSTSSSSSSFYTFHSILSCTDTKKSINIMKNLLNNTRRNDLNSNLLLTSTKKRRILLLNNSSSLTSSFSSSSPSSTHYLLLALSTTSSSSPTPPSSNSSSCYTLLYNIYQNHLKVNNNIYFFNFLSKRWSYYSLKINNNYSFLVQNVPTIIYLNTENDRLKEKDEEKRRKMKNNKEREQESDFFSNLFSTSTSHSSFNIPTLSTSSSLTSSLLSISSSSYLLTSTVKILALKWFSTHTILLITLRNNNSCFLEIISKDSLSTSSSSISTSFFSSTSTPLDNAHLIPLHYNLLPLPPGFLPTNFDFVEVQGDSQYINQIKEEKKENDQKMKGRKNIEEVSEVLLLTLSDTNHIISYQINAHLALEKEKKMRVKYYSYFELWSSPFSKFSPEDLIENNHKKDKKKFSFSFIKKIIVYPLKSSLNYPQAHLMKNLSLNYPQHQENKHFSKTSHRILPPIIYACCIIENQHKELILLDGPRLCYYSFSSFFTFTSPSTPLSSLITASSTSPTHLSFSSILFHCWNILNLSTILPLLSLNPNESLYLNDPFYLVHEEEDEEEDDCEEKEFETKRNHKIELIKKNSSYIFFLFSTINLSNNFLLNVSSSFSSFPSSYFQQKKFSNGLLLSLSPFSFSSSSHSLQNSLSSTSLKLVKFYIDFPYFSLFLDFFVLFKYKLIRKFKKYNKLFYHYLFNKYIRGKVDDEDERSEEHIEGKENKKMIKNFYLILTYKNYLKKNFTLSYFFHFLKNFLSLFSSSSLSSSSNPLSSSSNSTSFSSSSSPFLSYLRYFLLLLEAKLLQIYEENQVQIKRASLSSSSSPLFNSFINLEKEFFFSEFNLFSIFLHSIDEDIHGEVFSRLLRKLEPDHARYLFPLAINFHSHPNPSLSPPDLKRTSSTSSSTSTSSSSSIFSPTSLSPSVTHPTSDLIDNDTFLNLSSKKIKEKIPFNIEATTILPFFFILLRRNPINSSRLLTLLCDFYGEFNDENEVNIEEKDKNLTKIVQHLKQLIIASTTQSSSSITSPLTISTLSSLTSNSSLYNLLSNYYNIVLSNDIKQNEIFSLLFSSFLLFYLLLSYHLSSALQVIEFISRLDLHLFLQHIKPITSELSLTFNYEELNVLTFLRSLFHCYHFKIRKYLDRIEKKESNLDSNQDKSEMKINGEMKMGEKNAEKIVEEKKEEEKRIEEKKNESNKIGVKKEEDNKDEEEEPELLPTPKHIIGWFTSFFSDSSALPPTPRSLPTTAVPTPPIPPPPAPTPSVSSISLTSFEENKISSPPQSSSTSSSLSVPSCTSLTLNIPQSFTSNSSSLFSNSLFWILQEIEDLITFTLDLSDVSQFKLLYIDEDEEEDDEKEGEKRQNRINKELNSSYFSFVGFLFSILIKKIFIFSSSSPYKFLLNNISISSPPASSSFISSSFSCKYMTASWTISFLIKSSNTFYMILKNTIKLLNNKRIIKRFIQQLFPISFINEDSSPSSPSFSPFIPLISEDHVNALNLLISTFKLPKSSHGTLNKLISLQKQSQIKFDNYVKIKTSLSTSSLDSSPFDSSTSDSLSSSSSSSSSTSTPSSASSFLHFSPLSESRQGEFETILTSVYNEEYMRKILLVENSTFFHPTIFSFSSPTSSSSSSSTPFPFSTCSYFKASNENYHNNHIDSICQHFLDTLYPNSSSFYFPTSSPTSSSSSSFTSSSISSTISSYSLTNSPTLPLHLLLQSLGISSLLLQDPLLAFNLLSILILEEKFLSPTSYSSLIFSFSSSSSSLTINQKIYSFYDKNNEKKRKLSEKLIFLIHIYYENLANIFSSSPLSLSPQSQSFLSELFYSILIETFLPHLD